MRALSRAAVLSAVLLASLLLTRPHTANAQTPGWNGPGCGDTASTHVRFDMPVPLLPKVPAGYGSSYRAEVWYSAVTDLDGDAFPELVMSQLFEQGFTLHEDILKDETVRATFIPLPGYPRDVRGGDVDGDGLADLVFTMSQPYEIAFLRGRGDGTLAPPIMSPVGDALGENPPRGLALCDLDSDGVLDVAVTGADFDVCVLFGNPDGTFGAPVLVDAADTSPWGTIWSWSLSPVLALDVTGDGRPDLVARHPCTGNVRVLVNLGGRVFAPAIATDVPNGAGPVAAGDFDADGVLDLAVAGLREPSVLYGDGTGRFAVTSLGGSTMTPDGIVAADLDEDGRPDLVATENAGQSALRLYRNLGARGFERAAAYEFPGGVTQLEKADVDRDGHPDIVATGGSWGDPGCYGAESRVGILLGRGGLRLGGASMVEAPAEASSVPTAPDAESPLLLKLRLDGPLDDMVLQSSGRLHVIQSRGPMGMTMSDPLGRGFLLGVADLDTDGFEDVIAGYGDTIAVSRGVPGHTLAAQQVVSTALNFLALGRFDTDGVTDLLVHDAYGSVLLSRGRGDGGFLPEQATGYVLPKYDSTDPTSLLVHAAGALDLDLDGSDELAVFAKSGDVTDTLQVVGFRGDGSVDGVVKFAIPKGEPPSYYTEDPHAVLPADFNADGWPDLLLVRGSWQGTLSFVLNRGPDGLEVVHSGWRGGGENPEVSIADLNGDQRSDVLITSVLLNDAPSLGWVVSGAGDTFVEGYRQDLSSYPRGAVGGAFDDDPRPDVAVAGRGFISVLFNRTPYVDGPTSVLASLVDASVADGIAHLMWSTDASPAAEAVLSRKVGDGAWTELARVHPDGEGRVRFDDAALTPGQRHGYRLAFAERGALTTLSETWLDVAAAARLWLAGARPNPATDGLTVAFSLEHRGPGTLAVFDIAGRKVTTHDLSALAPGEHVVRIAERGALRPGVYLVRMTTPTRILTSRAAVVR
jgi:hypothetical protein